MTRRRNLNRMFCVFLVMVGSLGCADGRPRRYGVSGQVHWQGKLLDQGAITFLGENPALGTGGAMIQDGQYRIPAEQGLLAGRYKVMITSGDAKNRVVDPDSPPGYLPVLKDRIQPKYNAQTVLTAEVKAEGNNAFNFDVN
jgi:hypothetical protein